MQNEGDSKSDSCSTADWDWDQPFTDSDLDAIEAIVASATCSSSSSIRERYLPPPTRRRLPPSIFRFSYSPCKVRHSKMIYPEMKFGGQILYSRTPSEVERAAAEILKTLEANKQGASQVNLGFDIEWRPTFRRGILPGKVAVMQICYNTSHCHVMHIVHSGIPHSLQSILEDCTLVKVGIGIANDSTKVFKDYNVSMRAVEDLSSLANKKLGGAPRNWSLASLTEMLICRQLPKLKKLRLGNWEADFLSKEQLQYAATDAFASWHMHQVLKNLPDAADNE